MQGARQRAFTIAPIEKAVYAMGAATCTDKMALFASLVETLHATMPTGERTSGYHQLRVLCLRGASRYDNT
jgi:hypothetical protein